MQFIHFLKSNGRFKVALAAIAAVFVFGTTTAVLFPLFAGSKNVTKTVDYKRLRASEARFNQLAAEVGNFRAEGRPDLTIAAASSYLEETGRNVPGRRSHFVLLWLAQAHLAKGERAFAREYYREILTVSNTSVSTLQRDPTVRAQYATLCLEVGDTSSAERALEGIEGAKVADKYLRAAKTAEAHHDFEQALAMYRISRSKDIGDGYADRAISRIEAGKGGIPE